MTEEWKTLITEANERLGDLGERVFSFCDLELPASDFPVGFDFDSEEVNFPLSGLRFLGLVLVIFCSTNLPLASARWVRSTFSSLSSLFSYHC